MSISNSKMMLIYGFNTDEKEIIKNFIEKNNLPPLKIIKDTMGKMKLLDIVDGKILETYEKLPSQEKVILFNNFSDEELDKTIKILKKLFEKMPILAVVTDMSINWTFEYLLDHLIEERKWFLNHK